jgi:hypothetical protein
MINGMLGILIGFLVLEMLISVMVITYGLCTMGTDHPEVRTISSQPTHFFFSLIGLLTNQISSEKYLM